MEYGGAGRLLSFIIIASGSLGYGQRIRPALDPESSKKFFDKDNPHDDRPSADNLHFKHPYPVVQDGHDFDADYVKDENSDNGNWFAQTEYDRLRHKLQQEKKEAAKALANKLEEEKELKRVIDEYEGQVKKKKDAVGKAKQQIEESKKKAVREPQVQKKEQDSNKGWSIWNWWPFSWPKWNQPEAAPAAKKDEETGIRKATSDTEKAMSELEECQKELEKAQAELKDLMKEIEKAKAEQAKAEAAAAAAAKNAKAEQAETDGLHKTSSEEKAEYEAAKAAYLKQEAEVEEMEAELHAAAAKVKAFRDAEDRGGGVYNTDTKKSSAFSRSALPGLLISIGLYLGA